MQPASFDEHLLSAPDIDAGCRCFRQSASLKVVEKGVGGGSGGVVDARRRVGGGNGVERLFLGELVLSVGSPVKAEAHEAEHVVVAL